MKMSDSTLKGPSFRHYFREPGLGMRYFNKLDQFRDHINQVDSSTGITETIDSVKNRAIQVAMELKRINVIEDDVVMLSSKPRLDETVVILGVLFAGAQLATIDPELDHDEFAYLMDSLIPKVVFCDARVAVTLEKYKAKLGYTIYIFGKDPNKRIPFYKIFGIKCDESFKPVQIKNVKEKIAFITLTEGVNGPPKIVKISHYAAFKRMSSIMDTLFKDVDRVLSYFSLLGASQLMLILLSFEKYFVRVIPKSFNERDFCRIAHDYRVKMVILGTQRAIQVANYYSSVQDFDLSTLSTMLIGGSPTSTKNLSYLTSIFPDISIVNVYSVCECGFIAGLATNELDTQKPVPSGKLFPGSKIKIVDYMTNESVGIESWGELCYNGEDMFSGYVQDLTSVAWSKENYFRTGDLALYDENNRVYIKGRLENVFINDGITVTAMEIEEAINEHESVIESAATLTRNVIQLYCVVSDQTLKTKDLFLFLQTKLIPKKMPHKIYVLSDLPKTKNGKVKRCVLDKIVARKSILQVF